MKHRHDVQFDSSNDEKVASEIDEPKSNLVHEPKVNIRTAASLVPRK